MNHSIFTTAQLRELLAPPASPCVTLLLPTEVRGPETRQNAIRFKNLLASAEEQLRARQTRPAEIEAVLAPGRQMLEDADFWRHQSEGLALYLAPGFVRSYHLPRGIAELAIVSDRFHLKPVLALLHGDGRFYLLALSQNRTRLFEGTRAALVDVTPAQLPSDVEDALGDEQVQAQLQFHTRTAAPGGSRPAQYHGQGAGKDDQKDRLLRYFRVVNRSVVSFLEDQAPLILAAVGYLHPIYREANTYAQLLSEGIHANPDEEPAATLHQQAWALVEPHFDALRRKTVADFGYRAAKNGTLSRLEDILPAAAAARIGVLFVPLGVRQWGRFEPETGTVRLHDQEPAVDDVDLFDLAAADVIRNGGTVFAVDPSQMPGAGPSAAILRY